MARPVQKKVKLGEQLFVKLPGHSEFVMVDGFFNNRFEAERYREKNYPTAAYRIVGFRMNCEPVSSGGNFERKAA